MDLDRPGSDRPGSDRPGSDRSGSDGVAFDRADRDRANVDPANVDPANVDRARREGAPQSMRVLQILEATTTGVGRHALDVCDGLCQLGCDVHLVYSPRRMDQLFTRRLAKLQAETRLVTVPCDMPRNISPADIRAVRFVRRYIRRAGPFHVVHGHSSKGGAVARLAAAGLRTPAVYTPNAISTMNPQMGRFGRFILARIERQLARVPGKIIAVSPEEHKHLLELGIPSDQVAMIPNAISLESLPTREQARARLQLPLDVPVLGFIGRLSAQKGLDVLFDAMPAVLRESPTARLAVIGMGSLEPALRQQAGRLGIAHAIDWKGEQPGLESMPAFDLFILPSRYEGLPYVLIESMLAGVPAITTRRAATSLLIEPGVSGLVIREESSEELAAAINRLLSDNALRESFGGAARRKSRDFGLPDMIHRTYELYESLQR